MTNKQLVIDTLNHKSNSTIPYYVDFSINERARLKTHYQTADFENRCDYALDICTYGWFEEIQEEFFRDDFGVVWNRTGVDKDIGVVSNLLIPDIENWDYIFPEPDEKRFRAELEQFVSVSKDKFKIAALGFTMFERAWSLMGMPEALMSMLTNPEELDVLLDKICEFNLRVVDIALEYDIDCMHFGDDWGQQRGLIMGAPSWRRFIKPQMRRLYARVMKSGRFVSQHSCGDIQEIFPDLIEIGLDIYQTFQPEVYDIGEIKKLYGNSLTFWGGISTQQLLPMGTPEQVRQETLRIMREMSVDGGYIVAPTHQVPGDVPPENIDAMLDVFINQHKYL